MACGSVTDVIIREQGRVGGEIYNRAFARSPWVALIRRGVFPDGLGHTISVVTYERTAPLVAQPTWSTMVPTEGTGTGLTATITPSEGGGAEGCLPSADTISVGQTIRTYSLCRRVIHGPDFCVEHLRYAFQLREQLSQVMDVLTNYTVIEWEIRDRHEYLRLAKWKVACVGSAASGQEATTDACLAVPTSYWSACATSQLTQAALNRWRIRLLRDGAAGSAMGVVDGSPVLTLVTSAEQSEALIYQNTDIRQDMRWGNPSELLRAFGVERSYRGFYHLIDMYPIRGHCSAGSFTEVPAFVASAASKGNKSDVNSVWMGAYYEVSFIFDPTVFEQLIPQPLTSPGPNFTFDPVNYMGDWRIKNIISRDCNPDGTLLFHRGILAAGSKPVHPERGVAFLHLRCDPLITAVTCS